MRNILEALLNEEPRPARVAAEVALSAERGDAWRQAALHCSCTEKRERALAKLRALGVPLAESLTEAFPTKKVKAQYTPGLASKKKYIAP